MSISQHNSIVLPKVNDYYHCGQRNQQIQYTCTTHSIHTNVDNISIQDVLL